MKKFRVATSVVMALSLIISQFAFATEKPNLNSSKNVKQKTVAKKEKKKADVDVDKLIRKLMKSESFKKANTDKRKKIVKKFLVQLKTEKAIRSFKYDKENSEYLFFYSNGTFGKIMLKEFDPNLN